MLILLFLDNLNISVYFRVLQQIYESIDMKGFKKQITLKKKNQKKYTNEMYFFFDFS